MGGYIFVGVVIFLLIIDIFGSYSLFSGIVWSLEIQVCWISLGFIFICFILEFCDFEFVV